MDWAILQLQSYSTEQWLLSVGIAFVAAYFGGSRGVFRGHFLIALIVYFLDVGYAMEHRYMDMDIIFTMGVLVRVVLLNTVLLPVSGLGLLAGRK
jgi:hypothetical protein